jgi:putative membrane protein
MTIEALLAYFHIIAFLSLVVFLSSEAALCRTEWMNAAVVKRLAAIDRVYAITALAVLATGAARTVWGMKGAGWYWSQPLLHVKVTLFLVIALLSIRPTIRFIRWRKALDTNGALPAEAEIRATRRLVMIQAHLLMLIPLAAVFLARGVGTR